VLTTTDVDNGVTNAMEYDDLGRPTKAITAQGTALESWTRTEYNDELRRVIVRSDLETVGDGKKVAVQHFDQLGRVRLSRSLENPSTEDPTNEQHGIKVQTRYKIASGYSYQLSSNPYRAATSSAETDATMGWTLATAWSHGRRSEVETFSGADLPAPWGSNSASSGKVVTETDANTTTVTDQAGKQRRSVTNALGQLVRVDEPDDSSSTGSLGSISSPNQATSYAYDTLSNLTTVTQGVQTRTFVYSSLSRMTSETNPEAGATSYEFDNNGNPTKKTDSRGVSTHFVYDALNRVTQKSYTGESGYTTPTVTYTYDEYSNAVGRLTKVSSGISETKYSAFDKLGRVLASRQTTDGEHYDFEYTYNLAGMLVEQTYPSGRKVRNIFENAGELSTVQSRKSANHGFWNYAKHFTYNPAGAATSIQLGNGQWESTNFNSRLQPVQIGLGTTQNTTNKLKLEFGYGTSANNGNVQSQTITVTSVGIENGFTAVQTYDYDSLNRLKSAQETISSSQSWKQTFIFDRFGNRNFDDTNTTTLPKSCNGNTEVCTSDRKKLNPSVNTATNHLSSDDDYAYSSNGSMTGDAFDRTFKYDGENKQYEVRDSQSQLVGQYYFDGNGKRIKKVVPGTGETTVFVYDANGRLSAEYSTNLSTTQQVSYTTSDHLGSPRIKTDQNGSVISRNDYHPFGEDIFTAERTQPLGYKLDEVRQRFTGYEKDDETNFDFAQARMYVNMWGRFTGTDPMALKAAFLLNPQNINRYSYTRNNPLTYVDSTGLCPVPALQKGQVGICVEAFIAAPTIGVIGHGDNRTHGEQGTARARFTAIISTTETSFDVDDRGTFLGESSVTGGPSLSGRGRITSEVSSTTAQGSEGFGDGQNTSTMVRIEMTGITNGYLAAAQDVQTAGAIIGNSGSPIAGAATVIAGQVGEALAPGGTIDVSAQARITGSGDNIRVQGWGQSRPYPSVTGYAFTRNADGSITRTQLFRQDEAKPEDLRKPKRPIN
jgi:RHS repeat-associated protein